jgi:GNAT superfamily N-acetyltransferase
VRFGSLRERRHRRLKNARCRRTGKERDVNACETRVSSALRRSSVTVRESHDPLPPELARHRPDVHAAVEIDGRSAGQCSLWRRGAPALPGHRVGVIGHYVVHDDTAADELLRWACRRLSAMGCTYAIGPMDGNTWRSYRAVLDGAANSPFLLEPTHPTNAAAQFLRNGFAITATYFSAVNDDLTRPDPRSEAIAARMSRMGVIWRPLDPARLEAELRDIYAVSRVAFRDHAYFVGLAEDQFLAELSPLALQAPSELTWIARHAGRPIGFIFACPDFRQARRKTIDTVVIKTLGVVPNPRYGGLGRLLLSSIQQHAHHLGFTGAIHALVRDVPHLRRISARFATPFRRYALFGKPLAP